MAEWEQPVFRFEKIGLGYRLWTEDGALEVTIARLRRKAGELHGDIRVRCNWVGVKTGPDHVLHQARFNLSSSATRNTLAKYLKARTDVEGFEDMDWFHPLETLCQLVWAAEDEGEPIEAMNGEVPDERIFYAVEPLLPSGVVTILYGPGGAGKSVLALGIALSIATGKPLVPGLDFSLQAPALYLDWETDAKVVRDRVESICIAGKTKTTPRLTYRRCTRPLADMAEELSLKIATLKVGFVVIDSCGMAMGPSGEYGDANESTLRLFNAIRHLGVTALVVDHVSKQEMRNKAGKVVGMLPYGSVYKVNLARSTWELRNMTTDADDDTKIRLVNTKSNDSRAHPPIDLDIRWEHRYIGFLPGSGVEDGPGPDVSAASNKLKILLALKDAPAHRASGTWLASQAGTTPDTVRSILKKDGRVNLYRDPADGLITWTDAGMLLIGYQPGVWE